MLTDLRLTGARTGKSTPRSRRYADKNARHGKLSNRNYSRHFP